MTRNLTLKDFFVFLPIGCLFILAMAITFYDYLPKIIEDYEYLSNLSWGWLLLLIPGIYLIGHVFGICSIFLLYLYRSIKMHILEKGYNMPRCIKLLKFMHSVSYRNHLPIKDSDNTDEFWTDCALLQIEKSYSPAEYLLCLNELFTSLTLMFFVSAIISFSHCHWITGIAYTIIAVASFFRAERYGRYFVDTVVRLMKARGKSHKFS